MNKQENNMKKGITRLVGTRIFLLVASCNGKTLEMYDTIAS